MPTQALMKCSSGWEITHKPHDHEKYIRTVVNCLHSLRSNVTYTQAWVRFVKKRHIQTDEVRSFNELYHHEPWYWPKASERSTGDNSHRFYVRPAPSSAYAEGFPRGQYEHARSWPVITTTNTNIRETCAYIPFLRRCCAQGLIYLIVTSFLRYLVFT